jgi:hypothetical protein
MIKYIKSTDYGGFLRGENEGWKTEFVPRDKGSKTAGKVSSKGCQSNEEKVERKCLIQIPIEG